MDAKRKSARVPSPADSKREGERGEDRVDRAAGGFHSASGIDEEMRAPALLFVGDLACQKRIEPSLGHARPGKHALPLNRSIGADDDDRVDSSLGAGLEEKWNIEQHKPPLLGACLREEAALALTHERMHDRLKLLKRLGIVDDPLGKPARSTTPPSTTPGKASAIGATAAPR